MKTNHRQTGAKRLQCIDNNVQTIPCYIGSCSCPKQSVGGQENVALSYAIEVQLVLLEVSFFVFHQQSLSPCHPMMTSHPLHNPSTCSDIFHSRNVWQLLSGSLFPKWCILMTHPSNPEDNRRKSVWQLCSDTWFFLSKLFHSVNKEQATKTKINIIFQRKHKGTA